MGKISHDQFIELYRKYENGTATPGDLVTLEPYRVKRAILLASGFGSRMAPITINTPKPLVNVNGRRIISTILDALLSIDVTEIYIVTGYKSECFEPLKRDYPTITLLDNPYFEVANNISSAYIARNRFQNAYVFESDLYLNNPNLLKKYHYSSCYMGVPVKETSDWCFDVEDGIITDLRKGGTDCYHMFGISYWTKEDGIHLSDDLRACYEDTEEFRQRFWDDVPCVIRSDHYRVSISKCSFEDVNEIDTFAELQSIDPRYQI